MKGGERETAQSGTAEARRGEADDEARQPARGERLPRRHRKIHEALTRMRMKTHR